MPVRLVLVLDSSEEVELQELLWPQVDQLELHLEVCEVFCAVVHAFGAYSLALGL